MVLTATTSLVAVLVARSSAFVVATASEYLGVDDERTEAGGVVVRYCLVLGIVIWSLHCESPSGINLVSIFTYFMGIL